MKIFDSNLLLNIHFPIERACGTKSSHERGISISLLQQIIPIRIDKIKSKILINKKDPEYQIWPGIRSFPRVPENRNCCMSIASALGLDVLKYGLMKSKSGTNLFLIKLLRSKKSSHLKIENFGTLLKQNNRYKGSYEELGRKLRSISDQPKQDIPELFNHILLQFIVGNGDANLFSYSVLRSGESGVRLSPLYDVVSTKLYVRREEDSALTLNGKRNHLTREDYDSLADSLLIPRKQRYKKFEGKLKLVESTVLKSNLPLNYQKKLIAIIRCQFALLNLNL